MKWFAWTLGGSLVGIAAWMLLQDETCSLATMFRKRRPVTDLADQLQHAWAEPHNTAV